MHILSMLAIIILIRLQRFALRFDLGFCFRSVTPWPSALASKQSPGSVCDDILRVGLRLCLKLVNKVGIHQSLLVNKLLCDDQLEGEARGQHHVLVDKLMMNKRHVLLEVNHER